MNAVKEMADLEAALIKSRIDCETLLKDIEKDKNDLVTTLDSQTTDAPPNLYPVIPQFIGKFFTLFTPFMAFLIDSVELFAFSSLGSSNR